MAYLVIRREKTNLREEVEFDEEENAGDGVVADGWAGCVACRFVFKHHQCGVRTEMEFIFQSGAAAWFDGADERIDQTTDGNANVFGKVLRQ